jgi:hypothetical protein
MPHLLRGKGEELDGHPVARLPVERALSESWLQQALDSCPALLPVELVDDRVEPPLVSLGREISSGSGPIDNLFLSQNGYPVVVETKLWRNAEARRHVVAQILDYAVQLRKWDYSQLEAVCRSAGRVRSSLWEHVGPADLDEPQWIDTVNRNLSLGRLTLLIVGDGIRSQARELGAALSGHADFQFRLGMIELRLYELDDGVLAVPVTLFRTQEIARILVSGQLERVDFPIEPRTTRTTRGGEPRAPRSVLDEEAFVEGLRAQSTGGEQDVAVFRRLLAVLEESNLDTEWGTGTLKINTSDPASGSALSLAQLRRKGLFLANLRYLGDQLTRYWGNQQAAGRVTEQYRSILDAYQPRATNQGRELAIPFARISGSEQEFVGRVQTILATIDREAERVGG